MIFLTALGQRGNLLWKWTCSWLTLSFSYKVSIFHKTGCSREAQFQAWMDPKVLIMSSGLCFFSSLGSAFLCAHEFWESFSAHYPLAPSDSNSISYQSWWKGEFCTQTLKSKYCWLGLSYNHPWPNLKPKESKALMGQMELRNRPPTQDTQSEPRDDSFSKKSQEVVTGMRDNG